MICHPTPRQHIHIMGSNPHISCRRSRSRAGFRTRRQALAAAAAPAFKAPAGSRAAVVATVKNFASLADSFCTYHLAIHFEHIYIYFDDPEELRTIDLASRFPAHHVTSIPHDAQLRAAWALLPSSAHMICFAEREVQTRQQLNARHALGLASARGIDWLLHVDADELFYPGPGGDASAHFGELSSARVSTFCYMNHEAVPEAHGVSDAFREVTLFKRSLELVEHTAEAGSAVDLWQSRQSGFYFYYYDNGKAAVRVSLEATTLSVHEWLPPKQDLGGWCPRPCIRAHASTPMIAPAAPTRAPTVTMCDDCFVPCLQLNLIAVAGSPT